MSNQNLIALPLRAILFHSNTRHEFRDATDRIITVCDILPKDAALIVKVVNSHEALVAALRYVPEQIDLSLPRFKSADDSETVAIEVTIGWLREVADALALVDGDAVSPVGDCRRCASTLTAQGFCQDETCPYSDYLQTDARGMIGHPDSEGV